MAARHTEIRRVAAAVSLLPCRSSVSFAVFVGGAASHKLMSPWKCRSFNGVLNGVNAASFFLRCYG